VGGVFTKLGKMKRLPVQHSVILNTEEQKLPNGNSFYLPIVSLNLSNTIEITKEDEERFIDYMAWVENYNEYIISMYNTKVEEKSDAELDDIDINDIVEIDTEEVEVA
jgi:hypothetical protein